MVKLFLSGLQGKVVELLKMLPFVPTLGRHTLNKDLYVREESLWPT